MKKILSIIITVCVILLLSIGVWYGITQSVKKKSPELQPQEFVFKDVYQKELRFVFDPLTNLATLYFESYQGVELAITESASGVRYENQDMGLILWNKGEDVTLYQNEQILFSTNEIYPSAPDTKEESKTDIQKIQAYEWMWKETQMNDGTIVTPQNPSQFTLTFDLDERVNGKTDCNGFGGSYTLDQGQITFGPFMQTMMYCEGSQETEFVRMVTDSSSYMFDEDNNLILLIKFDSGSVIFEKGKAL